MGGANGRKPLWLRVERQQDQEAWKDFSKSEAENWDLSQEMMQVANDGLVAIRRELGILPPNFDHKNLKLLCLVPWRAGGCNANGCKHIHQWGPVVHLPYFWHQGDYLEDKGS